MIALVEDVFGGTANADNFLLPIWTPLVNQLCLAFIFRRAELIVPSIAGNSLNWVEIANVANAQGQNGITLFRAMGTPVAGQITVSLPANLLPANAIVMRLSGTDISGIDGSGAIESVEINEGPVLVDNDDALGTVTVFSNNAWAIMGVTYRNRTFTWPIDQTLIRSVQHGVSGDTTKSTALYKQVSPATVTTLGGPGSLDEDGDWSSIIVSVKPAVEFVTPGEELPPVPLCARGLPRSNAGGIGYSFSKQYGQYVS